MNTPAMQHFLAGLSQFGQSLWRSALTVLVACYTIAPSGTFNNFHSAIPWFVENGLGVTIATLIVPGFQGVKATAQSISPKSGEPSGNQPS